MCATSLVDQFLACWLSSKRIGVCYRPTHQWSFLCLLLSNWHWFVYPAHIFLLVKEQFHLLVPLVAYHSIVGRNHHCWLSSSHLSFIRYISVRFLGSTHNTSSWFSSAPSLLIRIHHRLETSWLNVALIRCLPAGLRTPFLMWVDFRIVHFMVWHFT